MKRLIVLLLALFFNVTIFSSIVYAAGNPLPNFKLPELPPLKSSTLSQNYSDMLKELEKQGWGKYKYNQQDSLPLPSTESPQNAGKKATEKFSEEYGNSSENQLNKDSSIPEDAYFKNFLENYKSEKLKEFQSTKSKDSVSMNDFLKTQLDMSGLWNFQQLKNKVQFKNTSSLLSSVSKPAGWNSTKQSGYAVPDINNWLNGAKAKGYGQQDIWNIAGNALKSITPTLSNIKDKVVGGIEKAQKALNDYLKGSVQKEKKKNGELSKGTLEKIKDLIKNEVRQYIPFAH